ncbi:MAG TPA: fatty acyl-AMP ligase [Kineosporiaceae bacterium]|nr:fatty acyl-AMP ligase [Kineosporiaceae bacterium]
MSAPDSVAELPVAAPVSGLLIDQLAACALSLPDQPAYTFMDYQLDAAGTAQTLTWAQVHHRAAALAARLGELIEPGDRVAVMAPSGVDYIVAMFAAWYAGAIAVPLFTPDLPGHRERLRGTYADCRPACVLTVVSAEDGVREFVTEPIPVLAVDAIRDAAGQDWTPAPAGPDTIAYLQYTSGSTRTPAGLEITHGNLTANVKQLRAGLTGGRVRPTAVNWLPLFHDMGLLAILAFPLLQGGESVLLDPVAFLMRPSRWLRLLSGRPDVYTCAPNFAYEYCLRRVDPADVAGLDLSGVFLWLNGAEPVRADTVRRFAETYSSVGMAPEAMCAAYGLAEATVFVAADRIDRAPKITRFDRRGLASGTALAVESADGEATVLVSCGLPVGQRIMIVDPDTSEQLPDGRVGEIRVCGPNVARRYWQQPERTAEVFVAGWLRTGDLGLIHDGELYVTGRLKDLLIVAGRNHYPQDVEQVVATETGVGLAAAFAVPVDGDERVVVVVERSRSVDPEQWQPERLTPAIRRAVWQHHELALHELVLTEPGLIPRTSSGKISRSACRQRYLDGGFGGKPEATR